MLLKKITIITLAMLSPMVILAQEATELSRKLQPFSRIVASPRVNLILQEGDEESVKLVYHRVDAEKINIEVRGKTLRLYLDDARVTEKLYRVSRWEKRSVYEDVSVTAYVTYRQLKHIEIRGQQELTCLSPVNAEKFKLKAYGKNEISFVSMKAGYLKTHLFGENRLKISGGRVDYQKYKLYGENRIYTEDLKSYAAVATIFGESKVNLNIQDELKVNSFGESEVSYNGNAFVSRGLIFGRTEIRKLN